MTCTGSWGRTRRRRGLLATLACALLFPATSHARPQPRSALIGVHSMLYLNHPFGAKQAMFKEAAAVGASEIRLDIALAGVFPTATGPPDWSGVDQYMQLARRYDLRVLADLLATPSYLADCPPGTAANDVYRCPPSDPHAWAAEAGAIAAHTRGVIDDFEIINEPDGSWAFLGSPDQYATILAATYTAIHRADPGARVALGGLMNTGESGRNWTERMLAALPRTPRTEFDIANIHVRAPVDNVGPIVSRWRRFFGAQRFTGPLWVTETGYPADPAWQPYPGYHDGPIAQARYLANAIPAMIKAGAAEVFVTERDWRGGRFGSEGFLSTADPLPTNPSFVRRPSFYALRALANSSQMLGTSTAGAEAGPHRILRSHPPMPAGK